MSALGLTPPEFWGSVIVLCTVGLVYFGRSILDAEAAAENQKPYKWGNAQRKANDEPLWLSHPMLAAATCLTVLFALKVML